ncbi:hypothetical protein Fmac_032569 [Flemingia macrophylla]|uniref:Uncharacterized protein n=1 Tax=Flemingia macrophylla TaxID=520843 RepID=A0ABD1L5Q1_9FABA
MEATLKGCYEVDKNPEATATIAVKAGDVKLGASVTTTVHTPSLTDFLLSVHKPDSFVVDYSVSKKNFGFKFMNKVKVGERPLHLTYEQKRSENKTVLDGAFEFAPANKATLKYAFDSKTCNLKYTYVHKELTTFEPSYDVAKNTWDFAVSRRLHGDYTLKASYQTFDKVFCLEWARDSKHVERCFKISASVKLDEQLKTPKLGAETTWNLNM